MPYSKQSFSYTGGDRTFTISLALGYLEEADIEVYVVGELGGSSEQLYRTFTFDSEFVVNVTEAIDNPSTVVVQRTVDPDVFAVDFENGDDVTNRNLMIAFRQNFMLVQEILDGRIDGTDVDARATDAETAAIDALASEVAANASAIAAAAAADSINLTDYIKKDGSIAMEAFLSLDGVTPTDDAHAASKKYVDDSVGGGGVMLLDGSQSMAAAMTLVNASPTADSHAARKKYVDDQLTSGLAPKAPLASPTLTGTPIAPTAAPSTNNTQIASTAYADAAVAALTLTLADPTDLTATTSGTDHTITGIAAGANKIEILFYQAKCNITSNPIIQIGDAGGIEATGYDSGASDGGGSDPATTGFILFRNFTTSDHLSGVLTLTRHDGNKWVAHGTIAGNDNSVSLSGDKELSGELDRINLTTVGGGTWDGGAFAIRVQ